MKIEKEIDWWATDRLLHLCFRLDLWMKKTMSGSQMIVWFPRDGSILDREVEIFEPSPKQSSRSILSWTFLSKERKKKKRNVHGRLNASWKICSLAVNGQSFLVIFGYLLNSFSLHDWPLIDCQEGWMIDGELTFQHPPNTGSPSIHPYQENSIICLSYFYSFSLADWVLMDQEYNTFPLSLSLQFQRARDLRKRDIQLAEEGKKDRQPAGFS